MLRCGVAAALRRRLLPAVASAVLVATVAPAVVSAQGGLGGRRLAAPRPRDPARRELLEREFRQRGEVLVRRRLGLTDPQMQRLRDVNQRFAGQRRGLLAQERATRMELRSELTRGNAADQARVAQLVQQAQDLQRQRLALAEQEQKELSTFMTPVQQAQYLGLQEQLRARARELRQGRGGGDSAVDSPG